MQFQKSEINDGAKTQARQYKIKSHTIDKQGGEKQANIKFFVINIHY